MIEKKLVRMQVSDLHPYERNPRKIPQEAVDDVKESFIQCGVIDPIEIDENNVILAGHTRMKALMEKKDIDEEIDVLRVSELTEEQKKKYRLLDNKTGEKADWDFEKLEEELEGLDFGDFDFGFDDVSSDETEKDKEEQSIDYKESISVVIDCKNDEEAERVFMQLTEEGYSCRISTL